MVEPVAADEKPNTISIFLIYAEISSGLRPVPVQYRTEVEADTASVEVSE